MNLKEEVISIFKSTLENVDPKLFLPKIVTFDPSSSRFTVFDDDFYLEENQKIYVIGSGKASTTMAEAFESIFTSYIDSGLIIAPPDSTSNLKKIRMLEGTHPIPDVKSLNATQVYLDFIQQIPPQSYVFNLISGGTSALLCKPVESISIDDLQEVFKLLIQSGAAIQEVNTVRKSLSQIKGGQLLDHLKHVHLLDIIISDVPDDDLRFIGSGPTVPQAISYLESVAVLEKYQIWDKLPNVVAQYIHENSITEKDSSVIRETSDFSNHKTWIASSAVKVAKETSLICKERGFETTLVEPAWTGSIEDFEEYIYQKIIHQLNNESKDVALIFFGECTVTITGDGKGGRNQELALRMAKRVHHLNREIVFLSAGTDGIDGPTNAAGAVIDENTFSQSEELNLNIDSYLLENDSYHFIKNIGGHILTGPTGNNVMDLQIVLIKGS